MAFRLKELVFIGKSLFPAEIVGFPTENWVEVKWLESAGAHWECIHPLSSVTSMNGGPRTRTSTRHFTLDDTKSEKKRAAPARTAKAAHEPRKIAIQQSVKRSKPPPKKPLPPNRTKHANMKSENGISGKPRPPKKRKVVASIKTGAAGSPSYGDQAVARMPDGNNDDSSISSDEELLAQARRQRTQRAALSHHDDDRKPAAKPTIRIDFSSSDDSSSSSSNDELLKPAARSEKSDSTNSDNDIDSSDDDADFAITSRAATRNITGPKPVARRRNKRYASKSRRESDGDKDPASDQNESRKTPNRARVKQEEVVPLIRDTFQVKDHVWVRDGNKNEKHAAMVTQVLGDDLLEIQWAHCKSKKEVPKNIVSLMFDLTASDAKSEGRPRRSTRARHQPERHVPTPIKKEEESKKRSSKAKKPRSKVSKTKNVGRRLNSKKKIVASDISDTDTDTEPAVQHSARTNIGNPVLLLDSSDSDSGLSVISVATFEYTAPGVDPKFRSLHNITNLNDFNRVHSWKNQEGPKNDNADMQTVIEGNHEGSPDEEHEMDTSVDDELQVASMQYSSTSTGCPILSVNCEPFVFDKERGTSGGEPLPSAGIQARAVSLDEPVPDSRRESNETANPEDLPDILLSFESDATVNEDRLTADTQELSRAFAAFGDCDFE